MREALSLESAPKLRLCTSITHELLYMGSHGQRRRNEQHASVILHNHGEGAYRTDWGGRIAAFVARLKPFQAHLEATNFPHKTGAMPPFGGDLACARSH